MTSTSAKRGDIAIIPVTHRTVYLDSEPTTRTDYHVTIVTSITRDGAVKAVRTVDSDISVPLDRFCSVGARGQIVIASKAKYDAEKIAATTREHTWPGHPNQVKAYESRDEVRDMVLSFQI